MLHELKDLDRTEQARLLEAARYHLARTRPAVGVMMLGVGLATPVVFGLLALLVAPDFFTESLPGRLTLAAVFAVGIFVGVLLSQRLYARAMDQALREVMGRPDDRHD
jgi:hypothetical protein